MSGMIGFDELYVTERAHSLNVAYKIVGDEAEDAVQFAFLKAWRHWSQYAAVNEATRKTWFRKILVHACYDMLRKRRRQPAVSLEDAGDLFGHPVEPAVRSHEAPIIAHMTLAYAAGYITGAYRHSMLELLDQAAGHHFHDANSTPKVRRSRTRTMIRELLEQR